MVIDPQKLLISSFEIITPLLSAFKIGDRKSEIKLGVSSTVLFFQQAYLSQNRCVIPIDALTGEFVASKLHHDHDIYLNLFIRRSDVPVRRTHPGTG